MAGSSSAALEAGGRWAEVGSLFGRQRGVELPEVRQMPKPSAEMTLANDRRAGLMQEDRQTSPELSVPSLLGSERLRT